MDYSIINDKMFNIAGPCNKRKHYMLPACAVVCAVACAVACTVGADCVRPVSPFMRQAKGRPALVVNGDNDHYFKRGCMGNFVPVEERVASPEGARRYLDAIAAGGKVTHYFACVVGQRANYASLACDPIWLAIDEAKARGEEPNEWPVNAKKMHDSGFDCCKVWCGYGRSKGVSVWISQRMNDVHHIDRPWNMRTNRFWYDHPELHRYPDHDRRKGGLWTMHALDYSKERVRDFEFAIFKELADRYDADGFELDFMRFWEHLTPGKERAQAHFLTSFIKRCRDYANAKAKERGHEILLSTRVPASYDAALAFGYDPETWAREGLVDMIAVANFWGAADFDFDFAGWQRRINAANASVTVLPGICCGNISCAGPIAPLDAEALAGWADNVCAAGAVGVYTFNAAYLPDEMQRLIYGKGLGADVVGKLPRRHLPSFHDCVPSGMSNGAQLPIPSSRAASVNIVVGTRGGGECEVVLALDAEASPPAVSLNGFKPKRPPLRDQDLAKFGAASHKVLSAWRTPFPPEALREGMNEVRVGASEGGFRTVWCEICDK